MKNISIIRNRGQLTIPDQVRKQLSWVAPFSAVSISVVNPDEIVIRPHQLPTDWVQIKRNIQKSRAISGKGSKSAAEFLEQDRSRI
ncbi:MAG: hypothetical protein V4702_00665 [Patescibacteria group bacterium]